MKTMFKKVAVSERKPEIDKKVIGISEIGEVSTMSLSEDGYWDSVEFESECDEPEFWLEETEIPELSKDWSEINDTDKSIDVPDEFDSLLNKIGIQTQFMLHSDKSQNLTICHILRLSEEFFHKYYTEKLLK